MSTGRVFVLGADDSEMSAIERLLSLAGEKMEHARVADGSRVNPGTAYRASFPAPAEGQIWVECAAGWRSTSEAPEGVVVIDHHRPGDPGFGRKPEEFWNASSIGQVFNLLAKTWGRERVVKVRNPDRLNHLGPWPECRWDDKYVVCGNKWPVAVREDGEVIVACNCDGGWTSDSGQSLRLPLIAAADHCLPAAYAGKCPGVLPEALFSWWVAATVARDQKDPDELRRSVESAERRLLEASEVAGLSGVRDLRQAGFIPNLPAAAAKSGSGYLTVIEDRDGRTKIVLGGCGEGSVPGSEPVRIFKEVWASAHGLVEIYGDPARGFAGGYLSE